MTELIRSSLIKIQTALDRILKRSETILSPDDFLTTPSGVERLESICMLLIAIGESVKRIDKATNKYSVCYKNFKYGHDLCKNVVYSSGVVG